MREFKLEQRDDESLNAVQRFYRWFHLLINDADGQECQLNVRVPFVVFQSDSSTAFHPSKIRIDEDGDYDGELDDETKKDVIEQLTKLMLDAGCEINDCVIGEFS